MYFLPSGRYRQLGPWLRVRTVAGTPPAVEFTLVGTETSSTTFRVPVPAGKEPEAEAVVAFFRKRSRGWG